VAHAVNVKLRLRFSSGEEVNVFAPMEPNLEARYMSMFRTARDHADARQTVPYDTRIIFTVGEELGFWKILEMTPPEDVEGRVY
jgi:hypothetical protein